MREQVEKRIERLASFPQLNTNPILEIDCLGVIIFHNDATIEILRTLGLKEDLNVFLPKDIDDILKNLELERKEQLYREVEIEGLTFAENIQIVPKYNVVRIYGSDITKRKQSEEHIRKLHRVFEQSQVIVVITDIEGKIEYINPMFTKITGYSFDEAISKNPRILSSGKQSSEIYKEMWSTIKSGHVWKGEFCNKKKDGAYYWESAFVSPLRNPEGIVTNFVKTSEDITNRKLIEDELVKSKGELEMRVAERTTELSELNKQLQSEIAEREKAIAKVKILSGFLPICAGCKKIRDDDGYWNQIEEYIRDHSEAEFTHSMCPECLKEYYPELYKDKEDEK